jgi:hypothetical protein
MSGIKYSKSILLLIIMLSGILVSSCSPATPQAIEVTRLVPQTVVVTQLSEALVTATPQPATPTEDPTATQPVVAAATETATPAPAAQEPTLNAWCMPAEVMTTLTSGVAQISMPANALPATSTNGLTTLLYPASSCSFVFNLSTPLADGTTLEFYDNGSKTTPWLKAKVNQMPDNPNTGVALVKHTYVVNPPMWSITYHLILRSPDGAALWSQDVKFKYRWQPTPCWDGSIGDFTDLSSWDGCHYKPDAHPWDPYFGYHIAKHHDQ